ncbi:Uncharacterised protein [Mycobacteroides abscessus subsp. abscessus]|nr:Uncharacterised protein [Mycobacteroides abscessus subsp. abscessus]SHU89751.1 Uncharacterised protein [Mycobacteroides abscessus subsp. abscessus]SIJ30221.1 Uncharacterised protein [Mycobacteroides abscessus subsp. abscessus]SKV59252.1 Uncharacterised protein [Mycobacteroides abscessus subsp. abscessus]
MNEVGGIELSLQEGVKHLGVLSGVVAAHHDTVECRNIQLGTVVEQLGLVLKDQ